MFKKISQLFQSVKLLLKLQKAVGNMKLSELKTSEGRLTLLLNVLAIYSAVQGYLPKELAAKIAVITVIAYSVARAAVKFAEAIAKVTPSLKDDAIVAEAGKLLDAVAPKEPPKP